VEWRIPTQLTIGSVTDTQVAPKTTWTTLGFRSHSGGRGINCGLHADRAEERGRDPPLPPHPGRLALQSRARATWMIESVLLRLN
jgi:hypothetical protein